MKTIRFIFQLSMLLLALSCSAAPAAEPKGRPPATAPSADAQADLEYLEYRVQPELGQISIYTGLLSGEKTVHRAIESAAELEKKGILIATGDQKHTLKRSEKLAGHTIETVITLTPPADREPDSDWSRHLLIRIDGHKKVDCSLGDADEADLVVYGIQIFPEDAKLALTASDSDGHELVVPDAANAFDDNTVITDDAFAEPADEEMPDTRPAPQNV